MPKSYKIGQTCQCVLSFGGPSLNFTPVGHLLLLSMRQQGEAHEKLMVLYLPATNYAKAPPRSNLNNATGPLGATLLRSSYEVSRFRG